MGRPISAGALFSLVGGVGVELAILRFADLAEQLQLCFEEVDVTFLVLHQLLEQVARRLESMVRADDVVARLGGDEFIVLQAGLRDESEAELLARRIIREISKPYLVDDIGMAVSVSVGIATAPKLGVELERLIACADAALYRAKAGGKSRALFCIEEDARAADMAA